VRALFPVFAAMLGCGRLGFEPRASPDGGLDGAPTGCQLHPAQQVSDATANTVALAWTGDGYLVAWIDGLGQGPYAVHTRRLDRWGVPVSPAAVVSSAGVTGYSGTDDASLQATAGGYAIAYASQPGPRYQVYMNTLALDGTRVGGDGRLTSTNVDEFDPRLASAGNSVAAVYNSYTGVTTDRWNNFGLVDPVSHAFTMQPIRLSSMPSRSGTPAIAGGPTSFAVAWEENVASLDFVVIDVTGQPLTTVKSLAISSDFGEPGLAVLGSGFVAGKATALVVFDQTGTVLATPMLQATYVTTLAADSAHLVAAGTDSQDNQLLLEILDSTTFAPLGAPILLADYPLSAPAIVTAPDGFGVAWVDSSRIVEVMTLCP